MIYKYFSKNKKREQATRRSRFSHFNYKALQGEED